MPNGNVVPRPKPSVNAAGRSIAVRDHGLIAETPADKGRTNFTDAELSVLPTANSGLEGPRPRAGERRWRVPDHPGE